MFRLHEWALLGLFVASVTPASKVSGGEPILRWNETAGVVLRTPAATLCLDRNEQLSSPVLRFLPDGGERELTQPTVSGPTPSSLLLKYAVESPTGVTLAVEREVNVENKPDGTLLREMFRVTFSKPLKADLEIERPFTLTAPAPTTFPASPDSVQVTVPLKNGHAKTLPLTSGGVRGEYRLGNCLTGQETPHLALPMFHAASQDWQAAVCSDPFFSTLLSVHGTGSAGIPVTGSCLYRYAASRVPLQEAETRAFGVFLAPASQRKQGFDRAVNTCFDLMLPDVPPGPKWLHEVAMVGYDFLSDDGQGWERDVRLLAEWLKPAERSRVALCLHGWYDALGSYCYDPAAGRMKQEWIAFERTRKVKFTQADLKRRLRLARDLGFRALLYFADGLAADSGVPGYNDAWAYRDEKGKKIAGWQGPDTFGPTYLRNPAHPEVFRWYTGYLGALLETYGPDVDGFVWDETFHARVGQVATQPQPAYCDRAMLALVKALRDRVKRFDPQKVFLSSDCIGADVSWENVPGYAMVADGTYQDTGCNPVAWSYGLFPNWRNTLWSCNWAAMSRFHFTRWGVQTFGVPVAISNGWGDDRGPSEWQPWERDGILRLFRERLTRPERVRFLSEGQAMLLKEAPHRPVPGDSLPAPAPGQVNWALAEHGSKASASSEDDYGGGTWPAAGAIDGIRDDTGWGGGHGWASKRGQNLSQWLQVDFGQTRTVNRLVVISYQHEKSPETAGKWAVMNYRIETWDEQTKTWNTAVTEASGRAVKVRVHTLSQPIRSDKVRIVVLDVAPLDGQARLLQLEAWGPSGN